MIRGALALALVLVGESWQIDLPGGWSPVDPPALAEGLVLGSYAGDGGRRLVVARLRGNTDGAYAQSKTYFGGLEEGVKKDTDGYRRLSARELKLGKRKQIPAYDLWYRAGAAVRGSRFVLLRGYAIVATIEIPRARRVDAGARKILESLGPATAPATARP
jgi:hypothetical protein